MFKKGNSGPEQRIFSTIDFDAGREQALFTKTHLTQTNPEMRNSSLDSYTYLGEFFQDEISGFGQYLLKDGSTIRGEFIEARLQRFGEIKFRNPQLIIQGMFDQGKKHGYCKLVGQNFQFSGYFEHDVREGMGILKENGDVYQGKFSNGVKHGFGEIKYRCQDKKFVGEMKNNLKQGIGRQSVKSRGEVYVGGFKNGKKSGFGKLTKGEELYIGGFSNGLKNGLGFHKLNSSDQYFGFYLDGRQDGLGLLISKEKEIKAEWYQGKIHGRAVARIKGKGTLFVKYFMGELQHQLNPEEEEFFLQEFDVLNHERFFQLAKSKVVEIDYFLDSSEKHLREALLDLNVEFDQELRKLNKELQLVMTRHQNIVQAHQKDMLKLREACLQRGVEVNEIKLKYLSG